jgi:hypothetical protein
MNAKNFMPEAEFNKIRDSVLSQEQFNYEKTLKKFTFCLDSSHAVWESKTVSRGDYILCSIFQKGFGDYSGCGIPLEQKEYLKVMSNYDSMTDFIDTHMGHIAEEKYSKLDKVHFGDVKADINGNGQLVLF